METEKKVISILLRNIINQNISENIFTKDLIEEVKKDGELFEYFLRNTRLSNISKMLREYKSLFPCNGDFSLEKDIAVLYLQEYKGQGTQKYTKDILKIIPEMEILEDKTWIKEMFETNNLVYNYIDEKLLEKLVVNDWFKDILLDTSSLDFSKFIKYIDKNDTQRVWKFLSHDLSSFQHLAFDSRMNTFIIDNMFSQMKSNDIVYKDWSERINIAQNLAASIAKYEEDNPGKDITVEKYKEDILFIGGYCKSFSKDEKLFVLNNRMQMMNEDSLEVLSKNPVLLYLTKGLDIKDQDVFFFNEMIIYFSKIIEGQDLRFLRDSDITIIKDICKKINAGEYLETFQYSKNDFPNVIENLKIVLFEKLILEEAPKHDVKYKVKKF